MSDNEMRAVALLRKEYDGESIVDAARDVHEAFDAEFTPEATGIPCSGLGIYEGVFTVIVEWRPEEEEAHRPAITDEQVREIAAAVRSWRETDDTDHTLEAAIREAIGRGEKK